MPPEHMPACSGDPIAQNAYPIDDTEGGHCWPGHSGESSAQRFECDSAPGTFAYDQYTNLTCGGEATHEEPSTTECRVDVPATLHSKIMDMGVCP